MHIVEPEVFLVAAVSTDEEGLAAYLASIGAQNWSTDAGSDIEELVEVMSRSCYMSFGTDLNPNITQVRDGNEAHLENILLSGHGSVLEHGWVSFMFRNVSRVFTHELVRHRVGVAISQESLRYVRLTDLGAWMPDCIARIPPAADIFEEAFERSEGSYNKLLDAFAEYEGETSFDALPFAKKKEYTSAARRVAPIGLATNIGWSCNMRTLRHVIEMRTDPAAEEEIRVVFEKVAKIAKERWPAIFTVENKKV